jgi:threonylcarbamoyladenosine tRNA methylthiotransferase MtaB
MVGFPGETQKDFEESCDFVEKINFTKIHIFKFSPRKGTPAAIMKSQIPAAVKELRRVRMSEISENMTRDYISSFVGSNVEVLIEREENGMWNGHTQYYFNVFAKGSGNYIGKTVNVFIEKISENSAIGRIT